MPLCFVGVQAENAHRQSRYYIIYTYIFDAENVIIDMNTDANKGYQQKPQQKQIQSAMPWCAQRTLQVSADSDNIVETKG